MNKERQELATRILEALIRAPAEKRFMYESPGRNGNMTHYVGADNNTDMYPVLAVQLADTLLREVAKTPI